MFFQVDFLERFLLSFPVYLLFSGILLAVSFISTKRKNKQLWIFSAILISLFFIFVFIFFYIHKTDFLVGFPLRKIYVFLFIIILNIIILKKTNDYYDVIMNFLFLLSAIAVIFFEKFFIIFTGLIIANLIFFYSGLSHEIETRKHIFYIIFAIFILGVFFNFYESEKLNKFYLTALILLMFGFSVFNTNAVGMLKNKYSIFYSLVILHFIIFYKILTAYKTFLIWQPVLLILVILFITNAFNLLTEEKYKRFLFYDIINNILIIFFYLFTSEIKIRFFVISLIFLYFLFLTSAEFIKNNKDDNLTVTSIKYNINKVKENFQLILNLFLNLILNIYIVFELAFSMNDNRLIKMVMFFILLFFLIIFLNKFFIFLSFAQKIKLHKSFLGLIYENSILFLSLCFYLILFFNLR